MDYYSLGRKKKTHTWIDTDKATEYFWGQISDINFLQTLTMKNNLHTTMKLNVLPNSFYLKVIATEYNFLWKEKLGRISIGCGEK